MQPSTFPLGERDIDRLGFGAMRVTGEGIWGPPRDKDEALRVLRTAVERGVTFIDTADSYGPQVSEQLIAEALHPYPAGLTIATKGGLVRPGAGRWDRDGRPEHLRKACEGSLKRLRVDRIEVYQLHAVDPRVPLEDSLGALRELQQEGKIHHIGLSNVSLEQLAWARRLVPIVSVQNRYSLDDRAHEGVLAQCTRDQIAFLPWAPLGSGRLTADPRLTAVAAKHQATPAQIALAWLLAHSPAVVVIPGTSRVAHLEENLATRDINLDIDDLGALERVGTESLRLG